MKKLILAGTFVFAATAAQAQYLGAESNPNSRPVRAYTTAGPAGAGVLQGGTPAEQSQEHADR